MVRLLDIIISLALLPFFLVVGLLVALVVKISIWTGVDGPGPILFMQERLGLNKKPFTVVKFRTMHLDAEKGGVRLAAIDDDRATKIGRFLRKSRLDEIPQIWNVLVGDMSMVGPRPIRKVVVDRLEKLDPKYVDRFQVKPGLTGYAQLFASYGDSVEAQLEKLHHELRHLDEVGALGTYCKLIFQTVIAVLTLKGR